MKDRYARLLAGFDAYAEPGWRSSGNLPFFGDGSSSENGLRPLGNFIFTAAMLCGQNGVAIGPKEEVRARLRERAIAAIT